MNENYVQLELDLDGIEELRPDLTKGSGKLPDMAPDVTMLALIQVEEYIHEVHNSLEGVLRIIDILKKSMKGK